MKTLADLVQIKEKTLPSIALRRDKIEGVDTGAVKRNIMVCGVQVVLPLIRLR